MSSSKKTEPLFAKKMNVPDKFQPTAVVEFVLTMNQFRNKELVDKVFGLGFETKDKKIAAKKLFNIITNSHKMNTGQLNAEIERIAKVLEINPQRLEEKKRQWFLNSYLRASDAFDEKYLHFNLDKIMHDIRNNNPPLVDYKLFKKYSKEFINHKEYQKLFDHITKKILENDNYVIGFKKEDDVRQDMLVDYIVKSLKGSDENSKKIAVNILGRLKMNQSVFSETLKKISNKDQLKFLIKSFADAKDERSLINVMLSMIHKGSDAMWRDDRIDFFKLFIKVGKELNSESILEILGKTITSQLGKSVDELIDTVKITKSPKLAEQLVRKLSGMGFNGRIRSENWLLSLIDALKEAGLVDHLAQLAEISGTVDDTQFTDLAFKELVKAAKDLNAPQILESLAYANFDYYSHNRFSHLLNEFVDASLSMEATSALKRISAKTLDHLSSKDKNIFVLKMFKASKDFKDPSIVKDLIETSLKKVDGAYAYEASDDQISKAIVSFTKDNDWEKFNERMGNVEKRDSVNCRKAARFFADLVNSK